ncbi:hypothetical protein [Halomonas denitrificans]|nr:hypothetical protein [Halomonas denitrificans]
MQSALSKRLYAALALLILGAVPASFLLHADGAKASPEARAVVEASGEAAHPAYPSTVRQQPTTSGEVYRANLDARIDSLTARHAADPGGPASATLAALHFHRFKVIGRVDDLDRALAIGNQRLEVDPDDGRARRVRAHILAGMHRFDDARSDLEHGDRPSDGLQLQIALATGNYAAIRSEFDAILQPTDDFYRTVLRGNLAMLNGRLDTASVLFLRAQQMYDDSNPYPLAWLHTQQGIALLRSGDCTNASRFFAAAVDRLPDYYLAVEHLAECERRLGDISSARKRYRKVIAQTGQPEFIGALADLERDAGHGELADQLDARAEREWNRLLQRHSLTFGDHAVDFFLERGQPERALVLAREMLERRRDVLSLALHARIAFENDSAEEGCRSIAAIEATGLTPPERSELEPLVARCSG